MTNNEQIANAFTYHKPFGNQPQRYESIRRTGLEMAAIIVLMCPTSIERANAIACLREAVMWANAAIACNEQPVCNCGGHKAGDTWECPVHGSLSILQDEDKLAPLPGMPGYKEE